MVGLTEYKDKNHHYFLDSKGRLQGEYKNWHSNGKLRKKYTLHSEVSWRLLGVFRTNC